MIETPKRKTTGLRILGVIRISHLTEETLSPEVQREKIELQAKIDGNTIIGWAEDLDVSGAVSIWNRDLEPWLTNPELVRLWDAVCVAKLDRFTRSIVDFGKFIEWCALNGKTILSVAEKLDFSTAAGRLFAGILVMFAQFERERMGERRRDRAQADKARGWWGGGWTPYGYRAVKVDDHFELVEEPSEVAILNRIAKDMLAGVAATRIADELNAEGVPTKRPRKAKKGENGELVPVTQPTWASTTIFNILRREDVPLDLDVWTDLQPIISAALRPKVNRYDAGMLSMAALCGRCGQPRNIQHTKREESLWRYYRCYNKACKEKMIRAEDLESAVNDAMTDPDGYGSFERIERKRVPGNDRQRLIDDAARNVAELNARFVATKTLSRAEYRETLDMLLDEQERAEAMPIVPDTYEPVRTGQTVAAWWETLTDQGKRHWLMSQDWKIWTWAPGKRGGDPVVVVEHSQGLDDDMRALDIDTAYWDTLKRINGEEVRRRHHTTIQGSVE
jgi:site-specific DNA recombinase